ncbi:MAG: type II secretion system F family protein [Pseudomonadota bacterium]|nr:type II secretion system F family protein [Pseudomonadota bacterium]
MPTPRHRNANHPPLSWSLRATLFAQLAAMEESGLPALAAFSLLKLTGAGGPRVVMMRRLLAGHIDLATAGWKSGLFTPVETALLRAAIAGGSPAAIYATLAARYSARATLQRRIRGRLILPLLTLIVAQLVQPLPALVSGALTPLAYLWKALAPLIVVALLCRMALRFPLWFLSGAPTALRQAVAGALLGMPVFGAMHARRNVRDFFEALALLLAAGMPMFDAVPVALSTVDNGVIRAELATLLPALKAGATLAEAIGELQRMDVATMMALVSTGEASGTLPAMLLRFVQGESERIAAFQDQLAQWLPRLFYFAVVVSVAWRMIAGATVSPGLD